MKLKSLVLCLILAVSVNAVFANNEKEISTIATRTFEREFSTARDAKWTSVGMLAKVTFTLNDQEWYAFYSEDGTRVALARNIHVSALPIKLVNNVREWYAAKGYWITEAFEISRDDEAGYYVTLENADEKVILKSVYLSEWVEFKRTSKE